jgi:hypothetical protein
MVLSSIEKLIVLRLSIKEVVKNSDYAPVVKELEEVEKEIREYREFLGDLQMTYDECSDGCTVSRKAGRTIDPDYLMDLYTDSSFHNDFIEQELERAHSVQNRRLRRLTEHCRDARRERREARRADRGQESAREKLAFSRHPKKD